ncbi:methylglyoxal reductase (NADPH-dependent) gre2 [Ciborinia camelliae]|nr:methylglyoxal reductase (NADPH-dependent) gre2 [Ciborinia camelliae]
MDPDMLFGATAIHDSSDLWTLDRGGSSFIGAHILDILLSRNWHGHIYSEADWNRIILEDAVKNPSNGYRSSKPFAGKAAWEFVEKERPNFTLSTMNPTLVLGPVVHYFNSLSVMNASNQRVRNLLQGKYKDGIPDEGIFLWVDVRDLALAHVKALEVPEAAGKRFFITDGYLSNKEICEIIRKNFPEYQKRLPAKDVEGGGYPEGGLYKFDHSRMIEVLGHSEAQTSNGIIYNP